MAYDLNRFITAQRRDYPTALAEIKRGRKTSHWIWYIFPQLQGLGYSSTSQYYGMEGVGEARAFLADPYLGANLREITTALLELKSSDALAVMGAPDDLKLRSSMTLFAIAAPEEPLFAQVLEKFFHGEKDERTVSLLKVRNK